MRVPTVASTRALTKGAQPRGQTSRLGGGRRAPRRRPDEAGRGRTNVQDLVPPAKSAAGSMSTRKRVITASTPKRGKPEHKYDA
ncbi:DUF3008 family protein [Burkholderia contaminans]|uniref:DUF3008 family protein n=1 Tax=Burkholderia contaminans TaxID=488447 RepID=UPI003117F9E3